MAEYTTDSSPGQFPSGIFPLPCSVMVRVIVRFMVWVRGMGKCPGEEMSGGKCPTLLGPLLSRNKFGHDRPNADCQLLVLEFDQNRSYSAGRIRKR